MDSPPDKHSDNSSLTLQDVAEAAGVSRATVSRVINGNRYIAKETKRKVKEAITSLGYRPDPALRALSARRFGLARDRSLTHLAVVHHKNIPSIVERILKLLQKEIQNEGFTMESFVLGDYKDSVEASKLARILYQRGIRGLFVLFNPAGDSEWPDLSQFKDARLICVGSRVKSHPVHSILPDRSSNLRLALQWARDQGYSRPGLLLAKRHLTSKGENMLAAYLSHFYLKEGHQGGIPPFLWAPKSPKMPKLLQEWNQRYQPDCLFFGEVFLAQHWDHVDPKFPHHQKSVLLDSVDVYEGVNQILNDWPLLCHLGLQEVQKGLLLQNPSKAQRTSLTMVSGELASSGEIRQRYASGAASPKKGFPWDPPIYQFEKDLMTV